MKRCKQCGYQWAGPEMNCYNCRKEFIEEGELWRELDAVPVIVKRRPGRPRKNVNTK